MLISFTISNYRSFGEEETLTMVASNKITSHPDHRVPIGDTGQFALRSAVIYGANAAGKSNLVKAIGLGQRLVLNRGDRIRQIEPFGGDEFAGRPSMMEFRFLIASRVFIYGFDVHVSRVQSEWLAVIDGDNEVMIFERNEGGDTNICAEADAPFPHDRQMGYTLGKLRELPSRKEQLFLNRALAVPEEVLGPTLKSVIDWFAKDLVVLPAGSRTADLLEKLASEPRLREFCATFLRNVGTGIGDLAFSERRRPVREWERQWVEQYVKYGRPAYTYPWGGEDIDVRPIPDDPSAVIERQLVAAHPVQDNHFALPFSAESDGTQALLHLLPSIASSADESKVLVLDELDRSLHPMLTWEFLRFFSESCPGARKQLIATTHESFLLNQELLRRDEYWFCEKDIKQLSHIYSLAEFGIRNDLKLQKGYLQGRFGAIPLVGGMQELERLLECTQANESQDAPQDSPT
ncbi:MAG: ATP-binding protein [Pirellulaceae bacterium]|nr:ATP-binding protein [Pirellulaceae bacterium]